jgi:hypothetical protein
MEDGQRPVTATERGDRVDAELSRIRWACPGHAAVGSEAPHRAGGGVAPTSGLVGGRRRRAQSLYGKAALSRMAHVLTLVDRNPAHVTYGCADRQYWHYRTADFASGMYQEAALALALAYGANLPGNRWFHEPRLRELAVACLRFVPRIAHRNGALDDYYPWEQAVGATSFVLRACAEACRLLRFQDPSVERWMKRAARWLVSHRESGFLANHEALVALSVWSAGQLLQDEALVQAARQRLAELLQHQTTEGWFPEYEGCDPGYHTVTVSFLADLWSRTQWPELQEPLQGAARFAYRIQHPDGTIGGEYGSRHSFHSYAHGWELLAPYSWAARAVADRYLDALQRERQQLPSDDRLTAHYAVDHLLAALDAWEGPAAEMGPVETLGGDLWFPIAGFFIRRAGAQWVIVNVKKGGTFRAFWQGRLVATDAGLVAQGTRGATVVTQKGPSWVAEKTNQGLVVRGSFSWAHHYLSSPVRQTLFRAVTATAGRLCPNLLRQILQRALIMGGTAVPIVYERRFRWGPPLSVTDHITVLDQRWRLARLFVASDATSIYVAASNVFQPSALLPWMDVSSFLKEFNPQEGICVERVFL